MTSQQYIEASFIKYENAHDEELILNLEEERDKNVRLNHKISILEQQLNTTNKFLDGAKKLNHKLEQDVECLKIQVNNLKNVNNKFIRTINNLQHNKEYIAILLNKRQKTAYRIARLVKEFKNMQALIKKKNAIIAASSKTYESVMVKAAHMIKETYGI